MCMCMALSRFKVGRCESVLWSEDGMSLINLRVLYQSFGPGDLKLAGDSQRNLSYTNTPTYMYMYMHVHVQVYTFSTGT